MQVVILVGGLGQRFKNEGYNSPKPLIKIHGKEMMLHVIDNLKLDQNDTLHIIYNSDLDKYGFSNVIQSKHKNINFIKLLKQTEGACETLLFGMNTLSEADLNKKFVILDCDNFYKKDILSMYRNQENSSIFAFCDNQDKPIFSYIKVDNNQVTEIKEKQKISNYANTGCYCFVSGHVLAEYCRKVINNNVRQNGEYYMSCVIDLMLKDNYMFNANIIKEDDFCCVGTPLQLKLYCLNNSTQQLRFCFDLDNTLVTSPYITNDYSTVLPIQSNIDYLKHLKEKGHYIIIHTARRMKTHNGNIGKVMQDISQVTIETLAKYKIPYDELYFGKPWADFYIDDKSINAYHDIEKETGIYTDNISERDFNQITTTSMEIIVKRGDMNIINGEIYWYNNIPNSITDLFPSFIKEEKNGYILEKINGISLSYLFIKESLTNDMLTNLLDTINTIHTSEQPDNKINIYSNYYNKLVERYKNYNYSKFPNSEQVYNTLCKYFQDYEANNLGSIGVIHGDPVFSNIMMTKDYKLKFIDMRGKIGNVCTIYGDKYYDYAKIYQSLIGYDEILLDKTVNNDYKTKLINTFESYITTKFSKQVLEQVKMITKSLLFTLIPLHNNSKCSKYYSLI